MQSTITIPPDASAVIHSMRALGYSFHDAVADIIDNSVSAFANNIDIRIESDCPDPFLSVFDDGYGMSDSELQNAMKYGSKNPEDVRTDSDLGRFGLGLKVASLSQCSKLTVMSKKDGIISSYCWDLAVVREDNNWNVVVVDPNRIGGNDLQSEIEKLKLVETGTLIIWQNFDILSKGSDSLSKTLKICRDETRNHISLAFHRYIDRSGDARNIVIRVNNHPLVAKDPFLQSNKSTIPRLPVKLNYHGRTIDVQGFILPHINKLTPEEIDTLGGDGRLQDLQGFYVYRNKRLILPGGTWFRLSGKKQLQNLARVRIDIPNDVDIEWSVDVRKSSVDLPEDFKKELRAALHDVLESSKRVYRHRGTKPIGSKDRIFIPDRTKGHVIYKINREHLIFSEMLDDHNTSRKLNMVLSMIEQSIPYNDIRSDFEEKLCYNMLSDDECDEYLLMAGSFLKSGIPFETVSTMEPFCFHPEIIEKLRERESECQTKEMN